MAVIVQQIDGCYLPRLICDTCQQPICDVLDAMAIYETPESEEEPSLTRVRHCHKAPRCLWVARLKLKQEGPAGMGDELLNHLVTFAARTGVTPELFKEVHAELKEKGEI
jgi:hypothetical protein